MKRSIHVITHFVSPYQVELFNAVAETGSLDLTVAYLHDSWKGRHWEDVEIRHPHCVVRDGADQLQVREWVSAADLVVFNFYRDRFVHRMIKYRAARKEPFAFWGERPAFRAKGRLGEWYRRWRLAPLVRSRAPIWGIGSWASTKYRHEFGANRTYAELPYYSDLDRFRRPGAPRGANGGSAKRFLYSGALSRRKGVDLLGMAFRNLVRDQANVHLTILGTGELEGRLRREFSGLEDRLEWAGFQDWQRLPRFYHRADFLVAPSRYDGWGLIVPEGLAAGLPVIASDRMGAAIDLIDHGQNGWICRAGDLESLTECLTNAAAMSHEQLQKHRRRAEASVARHQLADGARRFAYLCEDVLSTWEVDW